MPAPLIPPPADSLTSSNALDTYLRTVVSHVRQETNAMEVAVYLLDQVTHRLALRAWATRHHTGNRTDPSAPHDLTDHGIDGTELSVATLRNFKNSAPRLQRLVKPLHDGVSWEGAIVGVMVPTFSEDADKLLALAARELSTRLKSGNFGVAQLEIDEPESSLNLPSTALFGQNASGGTTYAPAVLYDTEALRSPSRGKIEESHAQAVERLDAAVDTTRAELERLTSDTASEMFDVVSVLFSAHVVMLNDEAFSGAIRSLVQSGQTPEDAVQSVVASFVRTFGNLHDARLAETAQDVRDLGYRLLQNLARENAFGQDFTGKIVLVEDVLPSDLIRLALGHASGLVILGSTVTAHISILAESLALPALVTADHTALEIVNDTMLLLDADGGKLFVSPSPEQLVEMGFDPAGGVQCCGFDDDLAPAGPQHTMADGSHVSILANVNLLSDARRGQASGAAGIGLYRSEFPFIIRNDFLGEEEQFRIYRTIIQSMPGKPVILRTADIGGDKLMAGREEEPNPFLGVRGIRFSLANRDLFRTQLRAMLRAGVGADLHIMFPMVASHDELEDAREELDLCLDQLSREGREHNDKPRIGAMVEIPSAVIGIEDLAAQTDFLSVGTNDLTMYLLAVDRTNERLSELYRSHHPIVLRTLADIARRVPPNEHDISVCGASAADPLMIPFYLGIGIRKLSVAPRHIGGVAATARLYNEQSARTYADDILAVRSLRKMDEFLHAYEPPQIV